jgi:hypothetical protein
MMYVYKHISCIFIHHAYIHHIYGVYIYHIYIYIYHIMYEYKGIYYITFIYIYIYIIFIYTHTYGYIYMCVLIIEAPCGLVPVTLQIIIGDVGDASRVK